MNQNQPQYGTILNQANDSDSPDPREAARRHAAEGWLLAVLVLAGLFLAFCGQGGF